MGSASEGMGTNLSCLGVFGPEQFLDGANLVYGFKQVVVRHMRCSGLAEADMLCCRMQNTLDHAFVEVAMVLEGSALAAIL